MTYKDYEYFIRKQEEQAYMLAVYEDCFSSIMQWFKKNRKYLKTKPISKKPPIPTVTEEPKRILLIDL